MQRTKPLCLALSYRKVYNVYETIISTRRMTRTHYNQIKEIKLLDQNVEAWISLRVNRLLC